MEIDEISNNSNGDSSLVLCLLPHYGDYTLLQCYHPRMCVIRVLWSEARRPRWAN